jgi:D-alanine-D-alanine ligase
MNPKVILFADIYDSFPELDSSNKQEWESKKSISYLVEVINNLNFEVKLIEPKKSNLFEEINLNDEMIFFNLCEGFNSRNRESYIPSLAEFLGIAYTGSDSFAIHISMNKKLTKEIAKKKFIPTKNSILINEISENHYFFPAFLKPNLEGSSLGIGNENLVNSKDELVACLKKLIPIYGELILEEYLGNDDLTIGVIGNYPNYRTTKLARIKYPNKIYDAETKSKEEMPEKLIFDLDTQLEKKIADDSIALSKELKIDGYARLDFKLDSKNNPFFLELNLTPGLSKFYSSLPVCYENSFGSYQDLVKEILNLARENFENNPKFAYGKFMKK